MSTKNLIAFLYDLAEYIVGKFDEYLSSGKIRVVKELHVKYRVEEFNYSKSGTTFRGTTEYIVRDELDLFALHEFVKNLSKESIFERMVELFVKLYGFQKAQIVFWLERFIIKLVKKHYSKELNREELAYMINTFINEIEGNAIDWYIEVWLNGVFLEIPEIELDKGVVLRAPRKEDLEYESSLWAPSPPLISPLGIPLMPDAIIEIRRKIRSQQEILPYIERLIVLLQLYKLCSVYEVSSKWIPEGVLHTAFTRHKPERFQVAYKCILTEDDIKFLPIFVRDMLPRIPVDEKTFRIRMDDHIGVALSRYQDVLLKPEPIPNKIAYATFGLEALYLRGEERGELAHKLALRVAKVLSLLNNDQGRNIMNNVKRAYRIRSAFVHGEPLKSAKYQDKNLLDRITEYLRLSLLIFLQLPVKKEKFIDLIDCALIDKKCDEELKHIIERVKYLRILKN